MIGRSVFLMFVIGVILLILGFLAKAQAHDIYGQVHGGNGQLCCGGDSSDAREDGDCAPAQAKAVHGGVEFLVRGREWVFVPSERITFLSIPGEKNQIRPPAQPGTIWAHFCGRLANNFDRENSFAYTIFGNWVFFCAFYPPSGA